MISEKRSNMNKRITELAKQAGMTDDKFGMFFAKDKHNEYGVDLEKFAELIVRECIDCAEWVGRMNTTAVEPVNTAHAIVKRIEKHFGGEE